MLATHFAPVAHWNCVKSTRMDIHTIKSALTRAGEEGFFEVW